MIRSCLLLLALTGSAWSEYQVDPDGQLLTSTIHYASSKPVPLYVKYVSNLEEYRRMAASINYSGELPHVEWGRYVAVVLISSVCSKNENIIEGIHVITSGSKLVVQYYDSPSRDQNKLLTESFSYGGTLRFKVEPTNPELKKREARTGWRACGEDTQMVVVRIPKTLLLGTSGIQTQRLYRSGEVAPR
jgi:hypothetical protein